MLYTCIDPIKSVSKIVRMIKEALGNESVFIPEGCVKNNEES